MTAPPASAFHGAKIALLYEGCVLTYLRDNRPGLPWPGHWDLPGGGREGAESPQACVLRELAEEFGLILPASRLLWSRRYDTGRGRAHFFGGDLSAGEIAAIRFGVEGQYWRMMPVAEFMAHPQAIPQFRARLGDFLSSRR